MARKLTRELREQYLGYVSAAAGAADDLRFLLSHLEHDVACVECTPKCLEQLEALYWRIRDGSVEIPSDLGGADDFAELACRFLGQCVVQAGGRWIQSVEPNRRFGQPCLDGFGNQAWDRIYPVELAQGLATLRSTNPSFPGARDRTVLSRQLRRALELRAGKGG